MLLAMGSHLVAEWRAFFVVENTEAPEDEEAAQVAALDLPAHAQAGLMKMLSKPGAR